MHRTMAVIMARYVKIDHTPGSRQPVGVWRLKNAPCLDICEKCAKRDVSVSRRVRRRCVLLSSTPLGTSDLSYYCQLLPVSRQLDNQDCCESYR
jgi:hypothetical protein